MKGNPFFGTMRGKLGEQVFMRTGGEQRARTYLKVINNPRTLGQMRQRVKLANLVAFYRILRPILGDSFLRRTANQSSYNAFVKANLASSRVYLTKEQASSGYAVTAPYTITDGTLQPSAWGVSQNTVNGIILETPFEGPSGAGYALQEGFKSAYMGYYADASEDDVLLFVVITEKSGAIAPTMSYHAMYINQLDGSDGWFAEHIASSKPAETSGSATYLFTTEANQSIAIVRARITNGRIVVCSTESIILGFSANARFGQFNTKLQLGTAVNSYGVGTSFAIQESVRNAPVAKTQNSYWVLADGTLVSSIVFDKPESVGTSAKAVMCFTGVDNFVGNISNESTIEFAAPANKPGNEVTVSSYSYNDEAKSLIIELETMEIHDTTAGLEGLRLLVTLLDKYDETKVLMQAYSAPFDVKSITV